MRSGSSPLNWWQRAGIYLALGASLLASGYIIVASVSSNVATKLDDQQTKTIRLVADAQLASCRRGNVIRRHVNGNSARIDELLGGAIANPNNPPEVKERFSAIRASVTRIPLVNCLVIYPHIRDGLP